MLVACSIETGGGIAVYLPHAGHVSIGPISAMQTGHVFYI